MDTFIRQLIQHLFHQFTLNTFDRMAGTGCTTANRNKVIQ